MITNYAEFENLVTCCFSPFWLPLATDLASTIIKLLKKIITTEVIGGKNPQINKKERVNS